MDQNTRVFYPPEEGDSAMNTNVYSPQQPYEGEYTGEYEEDYAQYPMEAGDQGDFSYEDEEENGDYSVYDEAEAGAGRFKVAMNVFDMASVLMGVVVILALTTLIVSMVSWLRADIMHSFVILQSRIQ